MRSKPLWSVPPPPPSQPATPGLDWEALAQCIHCGFCVESCPTYRQSRLELHSPRGRLLLMRAVAEGQLPVDEGVAEALDLCLGCRACETACPSGVRYGHLLEEARALTVGVSPSPWWVRWGLKHLLPYPGRMRLLGRLAGLAVWLGRRLLLPKPVASLALVLPKAERSVRAPARAPGALFFHGCVQEAFLAGQNQAALALLERAGTPAAVPEAQTCCGALHMHQGDREGARALARRNIAAFSGELPIINHAGGCGAHLKQYGDLLADDPAWAERARAFSARVKDLSEWLAEVGLPTAEARTSPVRVTYQDSCHLAHGQGVRRQPRALLAGLPGVEIIEMNGADQCCGSAGIYNLLQPAMSEAILTEKMGHVAETGARVLVTANPGCHLQLCQGVERAGLGSQIRVLSLAEFLLDRMGEGGSE